MSSPTRPGLGDAAKQVAEHASALARLELELATLELKRKAASLGVGAGLGIGGVLMLLYGIGFGLATAGIALSIVLDPWLAFLIVTGALFGIAGLLGLVAIFAIKRGSPPIPEQAIEEAKRTTEALRSGDGRA